MATIKTSIMVHDVMSQQFRAMNMAMATVIDSFQTLQDLSGKAVDVSALEAAQRELQQVEANFSQIEQEIKQAENAQENFNKDLNQADNYARKLLGTLGGIVGTYFTLQGIKDGISLSDEMANTTARLDLINDGLITTEELQQKIFDSAQRTYAPYQDTADMVAKLAMQARQAFANNEEVVAFAEQINKTFKIAGTPIQGMESVMLQLTQAMAAGALQGEELNAILDNAQPIVANIQRYLEEVMNIDASNIKKLASEGVITAEIIKNAMFYAAAETNAAFESMSLTYSDLWTNFKNEAVKAFTPVLEYLNQIANSEKFQAFVNSAKSSLYTLSAITLSVLQVIASVGEFVYDNWSGVEAILKVAGSALLALAGYLTVLKLAAFAATIQQWKLNAAMMANPIGLVIAAIIILIGLYFVAVDAINHFAGTNLSAIGLIVGAYAFMYSVFYNVIAYMLNSILSFAEFWVNVWRHPVYTIKRYFANLANSAIDMATSMIGSFDSAATNLANMFISGANMAIRAINWVIDALNKIPGIDLGKMSEFSLRTSLTADYSGLKNIINDWVGEMPEDYWEAPRLKYMSPLDNAIRGHEWGANLFSGFDLDLQNQERFNMEKYMKDILNSVNGLGDAIDVGNGSAKDTAGNTGKLADSVDLLEEDMKYLRDAANVDAINRYTTGNITVDMRGMQNKISSDMDIDGIIEKIVVGVEESIDSLPEGV